MSGISKSISLTSSSTEDHAELRRGPWTLGEDTLLIHYIAAHGEGCWNLVGKRSGKLNFSGLRRSGKSCRLRWLNYLKPDVKRGNLSPQEQLLILELHSKWGNRWSKIAQQLPGRTDNEIKNYWRTRVQKQARHLKMDTNSTAFHDIIRSLWMPRLPQKIQLPNSTVPPPPAQAEALSQGTPTIGGTIDHQELNLDYSCISSSESTNISQSSHFPEELPIGDNDYNGCYYVDGSSCDMECFCLENNSQSTDFEYPVGDCQVSDNDWVDNDFAYSMWNVDELWQFRNF